MIPFEISQNLKLYRSGRRNGILEKEDFGRFQYNHSFFLVLYLLIFRWIASRFHRREEEGVDHQDEIIEGQDD